MATNAKWYHMVTLKMRVKRTSYISVERATKASPKAVRRLAAGGTDCITEPV